MVYIPFWELLLFKNHLQEHSILVVFRRRPKWFIFNKERPIKWNTHNVNEANKDFSQIKRALFCFSQNKFQ